MSLLLDLPPELFVRVLLCLPLADLVACRRVCRVVDATIQSTTELQYAIELAAAGAEDDPSSPLVLSDRLRLLKEREAAWAALDLQRVTHIPVTHQPSNIYDLAGGMFVLGETFATRPPISYDTDALHAVRLPSALDKVAGAEPEWMKINLGASVVEIGMAPVHDLMAVATYKWHPPSGDGAADYAYSAAIKIHLLQLSTGALHPLAAQPVLYMPDMPFVPGRCAISMEIVGDTLGILFNLSCLLSAPYRAAFHTFNWTTGKARQIRHAFGEGQVYNMFAFLSDSVVLLPNLATSALELCPLRSPADDAPGVTPLETACALQLPPLAHACALFRICCRAPPASGSSTGGAAPFAARAADALVQLSVYAQDAEGLMHAFLLVVHRSALLARLPPAPTARADAGKGTPWDAWGPPVCRWFDARDIVTRWLATACGQRCVVVMCGAPAALNVLDFNQAAIRRGSARAHAARTGNGVCFRTNVDRLWAPVFRDAVCSYLPYVVTTTTAKYEYAGVLIDEERIIGLKLDPQENNITELVVHQL